MAIELICNSSRPSDEAEGLRSAVAATLKTRYGDGLVHYEVRVADKVDRELADEFGLRAASKFIHSVNDKEALAPELRAVAIALREQYGADRLVLLLDNETPMG